MLKPGIHNNVPMRDYIGDPCPEPSLSTGVVCTLAERSPAHAHAEHPRLGGKSDDGSARADLGSAAHAMLLGGADTIAFIDAEDWRTKAAKEAQEAARAAGKIPMLVEHADTLAAMHASAKAKLETFGAGDMEQTLTWNDGGVWCRSRPDWIREDRFLVVDYKTADVADPTTWIRRVLFTGGYDVQAALVLRGLDVLLGEAERQFVFLVGEIAPPYACSLVGVSPAMLDVASRKIAAARRTWRTCLQEQRWPGYDERIHWAEAPGWVEWDWESRISNYGAQP